MEQPNWKQIKLSLERPYKNDDGARIPTLLDITPEGPIYEVKEDPSRALGENLRRVFAERGVDFFDKNQGPLLHQGILVDSQPRYAIEEVANDEPGDPSDEHDTSNYVMTAEDLFKMRMDILPHLYTALGETSHAKDLLALLLDSTTPIQASSAPPIAPLTAAIVSKPAPIPSVQAFNAQLVVGGKDEMLRKSADLFKTAAVRMEKGRVRGDKYWVDALKIRRANWGLIPAPLPYGYAAAKSTDKTSKDFLISFGLEESPPSMRRQAVGHMATSESEESDALVFPYRQATRLCVSLTTTQSDGEVTSARNNIVSLDDGTLIGSLRAAQQEIVEQEIFAVLIREASNLPTASARVAERLVVIDAAQGIELRFELVGDREETSGNSVNTSKCDLIASLLQAFLLHIHSHLKSQRLGVTGVLHNSTPGNARKPPPPLLQPIIDILQYQVFCNRVNIEVNKVVKAVKDAGIPANLMFDIVGETGSELVGLMNESNAQKIGGECVLRIDQRHTLRFTLLSPSSLTAHLPQATLILSSIPQLVQLLSDEVEIYILNRICEVGNEICARVNGIWFVDTISGRSVGRWEGCVLNFRIFLSEDMSIRCSAFRLDQGKNGHGTLMETYTAENNTHLLDWIKTVIEKTLSSF